jgi:fatty-acyl-CoA synthase
VVINTGGEKVFPEEVEEAIKMHPAVLDALVVGVPDDRFGEAITAVVALNAGGSATEDEIGETVREHLAGFKRPRTVVFVEQVRRGPNGKADYAWAKETAKEFLGL